MRRIVHSVALASAIALSACSGGGSVLSFDRGGGNPDRVIVTTVGTTNVASVLPGASIALSATGVRGSQNGVGLSNRFLWSARLVTSGQYPTNASGQTKPCAAVLLTPFGGSPTPLAMDYSANIAIDPTNEANIIFVAPILVPNPTPSTATVQTVYPYCVVVTATSRDAGGASGSITVAVVNPANPLQ